MRIALVVPSIEPAAGGLARNVPRLAVALRQEGVDVDLCSVGKPLPGIATPAVFLGAPRWPRRLGHSPELALHLREGTFDLIHANGLWMAPLGYAASAATKSRVPLVVSPRGMLSPWARARSRWKKTIARLLIHPRAFAQAAGWHVTSKEEEEEVRRLGYGSPVCLAPNGIEPLETDAEQVRSIYESLIPGITRQRVLLFYSRLHSKKGVMELIKTFAPLSACMPGWQLLVVGIPEEYSVERLRDEARRQGVADRVSILDGRTLPAPYPLAELMVLPSRSENFGQVIAEALVSGVPVVTTTDTPWTELNDRRAGVCVERPAIADALERWMRLPVQALRAAGDRGRAWVLADFSWQATAHRLAAFYGTLACSRPAARPS
jgi:glycosyltransferase involved in cell wall biosynthesis